MKARNLLFVFLAAASVIVLSVTPAQALLVKVSVNFGPTITGPDNGMLVVAANPGDTLRITWALPPGPPIEREGREEARVTHVPGLPVTHVPG